MTKSKKEKSKKSVAAPAMIPEEIESFAKVFDSTAQPRGRVPPKHAENIELEFAESITDNPFPPKDGQESCKLTVYVTNIHFGVVEKQITELVEGIKDVRVIVADKYPYGIRFCFLQFATPSKAKRACRALNGAQLNEVFLRAEMSNFLSPVTAAKTQKKEKNPFYHEVVDKSTLKVSNLPQDCTKSDLRYLIPLADIYQVRTKTDIETGKSERFALIKYKARSHAKLALTNGAVYFKNKKLSIDFYVQQVPRQSKATRMHQEERQKLLDKKEEWKQRFENNRKSVPVEMSALRKKFGENVKEVRHTGFNNNVKNIIYRYHKKELEAKEKEEKGKRVRYGWLKPYTEDVKKEETGEIKREEKKVEEKPCSSTEVEEESDEEDDVEMESDDEEEQDSGSHSNDEGSEEESDEEEEVMDVNKSKMSLNLDDADSDEDDSDGGLDLADSDGGLDLVDDEAQ